MTVECLVYRPDAVAVNVFGDAVDNDGNVIRPESTQTYLGPLRIALSGVQAEPILSRLTGSGGGSVDRAEAADVNLMIGAPRHAAIKLRHGDRLIVPDSDGDGTSLVVQVVGPRLFDAPNSLTPGWDHRLYWISGLATDGSHPKSNTARRLGRRVSLALGAGGGRGWAWGFLDPSPTANATLGVLTGGGVRRFVLPLCQLCHGTTTRGASTRHADF